jgi:hypothetical protein
MVGGSFSDFMGAERYSMVKLIQGTVGTSDQDRLKNVIKVYPNPATEKIRFHFLSEQMEIDQIRILDLSGRMVAEYPWRLAASYDISNLAKGIYLVQLSDSKTVIGIEKLVVQ